MEFHFFRTRSGSSRALLTLGVFLLAQFTLSAEPSKGLGILVCEAVAAPASVHAQGMSEAVGDTLLSCTNFIQSSGGDQSKNRVTAAISASLNVNVTNPANGGLTDAIVVINENTCPSPASAGSTFGSCGAPNAERL